MSSASLETLGWDAGFAAAFEGRRERGVTPGRVVVEHNHLYRVTTADGDVLASVAGKLRHEAVGPEMLPAVGDWVGVRVEVDRRATIRFVLPRRTAFSRKAAGDPTTQQVVAANVDTVFLVTGLDSDFNLRRLERYLVAAAASGAQPVVILNKTDLVGDSETVVTAIAQRAPDTPVLTTSCVSGHGLDQLQSYLAAGRTLAFLGSSGVGKSTLINAIVGEDRQRTRAVRPGDSRGRHTTVHRELLVIPGGGVVIDTPGMRELQAWDASDGLEQAFDEVEQLAQTCRFRDCRHRGEPGCAVRAAIDDGRLPAARVKHYHELQDERAALSARRQQLDRLTSKKRAKTGAKAMRVFYRGPRRGPR